MISSNVGEIEYARACGSSTEPDASKGLLDRPEVGDVGPTPGCVIVDPLCGAFEGGGSSVIGGPGSRKINRLFAMFILDRMRSVEGPRWVGYLGSLVHLLPSIPSHW
jgi:hypothetical protein